MTGVAALSIPDVSPDDDACTAALAYAKCGWYVIPIEHSTKHPGSVLGRRWQELSTRDPEQIIAMWAGTNHGIALHCGRSGAVVLDVDNPDATPDVVRQHGGNPPTQLTRPDTPDRRHLVYAVPAGRRFGNSNGKLGGAWGEVRGQNGVIVVAPSHHPDGGEYRWTVTGDVPELPAEIAAMLPDADKVDADAATDEQVGTFLAVHTAAAQPHLIGALVNRYRDQVAAGHSRHQTGISVMAWAMDEAAAGVYSAREADKALRPIFIASKTDASIPGKTLSERQAAHAWDGIRAWAIGRALAKTADRRVERAEKAAGLPTLEQLGGVGKATSQAAQFLTGLPTTPPTEQPAETELFPVQWASTIRKELATWAWDWDGHGRIQKGALTLFAGRPEAGKSTCARHFAARWSTGELDGCWVGKPVSVAYIASEESWTHTIAPSLEAANANMDRICRFSADGDRLVGVNGAADRDKLIATAHANDIRVYILDPLMSATVDGKADLYRSNEIRELLTPWAEVAQEIDGVVLGISHLVKAARSVTSGINGSGAFGEIPRCIFGFAVDRDAGDRVMSQDKNSSGMGGLNIAYRIGQGQFELSDGTTGSTGRFEIIGNTDRNVNSLLAEEQTGGGARSAANECVQWLKGYLTMKGPTQRIEIVSDAAGLGFTEARVKKAAQKLGVQIERTREVPSKTIWHLGQGGGDDE